MASQITQDGPFTIDREVSGWYGESPEGHESIMVSSGFGTCHCLLNGDTKEWTIFPPDGEMYVFAGTADLPAMTRHAKALILAALEKNVAEIKKSLGL